MDWWAICNSAVRVGERSEPGAERERRGGLERYLVGRLCPGRGELRNVFRSVILIECFEQRFATDLETMCAPARC
jgi:hypothetical protein